jgi:hypothetical protein
MTLAKAPRFEQAEADTLIHDAALHVPPEIMNFTCRRWQSHVIRRVDSPGFFMLMS